MPYRRGRPLADVSIPFQIASALTFYCIWPVAELINFIFFSGTYKNRYKLKNFRKAILISNHTNAFDPVHISGIMLPNRTWHTMLEATVLSPVLGTLTRLLGGVPVPLGKASISKMLQFAEYSFKHRRFIHFYPEGECFLYSQTIKEFKPGAFYLAAALDIPVIPLVTVLTEGRHKRWSFWGKPFPRETLVVMDPLYPSDYVKKDDKGDFSSEFIREFAESARKKMQDEIGRRGGTSVYDKGKMARMKGINDC